jgi:hypothetical protein
MRIFDPTSEIKKVNFALAEANVSQDRAPESLAIDYSSTAPVTQCADAENEFQAEYNYGHPDNYSNCEALVSDGADSDTEEVNGITMIYTKEGRKSEFRKSKKKTQVIPPCPLSKKMEVLYCVG